MARGGGGFDVEFKDVGVDSMERLGKDLREAGAKDLRKELLKAGQQLTKPVKENIKEHALTDLPKRGNLNVWTSKRLKTTTQVRLAGKNVGVRFKTKHPGTKGLSDLPSINDGDVRHPLFGNTNRWYTTHVHPGFVTRAVDEMAPEIRKAFLGAVDEIAAKLRARG